MFVDSNFFDMFSFKFRKGNPATALTSPNSVLLTEEIARKYFGDEDAIGKALVISGFGQKSVVKVCGILENIPLQSHIQNHIILPASWLKSIGIDFDHWEDVSFRTYVQLGNPCNLQELSSKIKACEVRHFPNQNTQNLTYSFLPLTKIHLYAGNIKFLIGAIGDIKYVRIFILVAVIILLIASINYMNLSTALSLKRSKEIGIRKAVGANRKMLIFQFLGESIFLSLIALSLAILLVELILPEFNLLSGKQLVIKYNDPDFIGHSLAVTIITGLISGCYPAILLSSFNSIHILKDKLKLNYRSLLMRKGLIIFQFTLSVVIIICTIVVFDQLSFIRNSNPGFNKENIICIRMPGDANRKYEVLKNELEKNPEIINISRSEPVSTALSNASSVNWPGKPANEEKHFWVLHTDYNLAATYEIKMSEGRFFSKQFPADQTDAFVINEAAAKSMGLKSPIGEEIELLGKKGKIIGVTKDFHFASFHSVIEPLIFTIPDNEHQNDRLRILSIRFKSGTLNSSLASIEKAWKEQMTNIPFNYYFYDESLDVQYSAEQRMGTIFKYFSFLSIIIACLGLFGLASLSMEQRTKEIGIRKVLGASVLDITINLSKEFLLWIILANIIAWPIAYYAMHKWLQNFAYRIYISWWIYALAGIVTLFIASLTVSLNTYKAATRNPVNALRYE
jgi:ABC-type antimicrobial peptide transport system permease subunit